MTGPDVGSYRRQLCRLRQEIEAARDSAADAAGIVELDQARVGRLSRMDALQAQAMSQASGRRQQRMLHEIDAALVRLDQGTFGICLSCEGLINPKRLEFDPTVALCIDCAAREEQ